MDNNSKENILKQIQSLKKDSIHHFEYSKTAKIPFKVYSFVEIMNHRMCDTCESIELLIKSNHIIPSVPLFRSLFENVAITYRMVKSIEESLKSNKLLEDFDELISKITFGTRYEGEIPAINVITQIDKLEKKYKGIKKLYESLSEFVHPNWDGVQGSYSKINEKKHITELYKVFTSVHPLCKGFEDIFIMCMTIYVELVEDVKSKLPEFALLCEKEIQTKSQ